MAKGWHNEPRRHSLASKGVKTAVTNKPFTKVPSLKKWDGSTDSGSPYFALRQKGYSHDKAVSYLEGNKEVSLPINSDIMKNRQKAIERLEKIKATVTHTDMKKEIQEEIDFIKKYGLEDEIEDTDGDGMPDSLDCDPYDPEEQGFFDDAKKKVLSIVKKEPNDEKIKRLREELEEKEEALERKKEAKLLKLQSKVAEKKALAQIKEQEAELDKIQEELEEGTFKQRLKTASKTAFQQSKILGSKAIKRAREEFSDKKPKKYTKVELTPTEEARTSTATQNKLRKQRKQNAETEAKIELAKLEKEEKQLKKQLKMIKPPKKRKPKKEKGWFEI